jgi:C4-dicarboxylate-binding protein DctP
MKKALAAAAILAVGLIALPAAAETILRITLQLPIKSHLGVNLEAFEKEVEARSNGEIQVEIYPAAQLYKDSEVPQAVSSGAIEMGVASITQFAGTIPAVDIFYRARRPFRRGPIGD